MKRFDSSKLFKLACQDVVERFHLLISLLFVLVRNTVAVVGLALATCLLACWSVTSVETNDNFWLVC